MLAAILLVLACQNESFLSCLVPKWAAKEGDKKLRHIPLFYAPFL